MRLIRNRIQTLSILVLVTGMLFSCSNSKKEIERITYSEDFPDETTRDAVIRFSDSAQVMVILTAPIINRYVNEVDPYTEMTEGMHVVFYTDSGTVDTDISADYAKHLPEQRVIEAENNVIVKNSNGDILSTEQLTWDIGGKRIFSNAFVKITTGEEIIYGDGLESNQEFTKYQIKHIKGIISVDEENSTNEDVQ